MKGLMKEITPRFGPGSVQSDNGWAFISRVVATVSQTRGTQWKPHVGWRPQSLGKTERTNHTLKKVTLAKLCQEAQVNQLKLSPTGLTPIRAAPKGKLKLSPFEMLYGRAFPGDSGSIMHPDKEIKSPVKHVTNLGQVLSNLHIYVHLNPFPTGIKLHPYEPGEWVYLKSWKSGSPQDQLKPIWTGPYLILLTTHSSLKMQGMTPWIHQTQVK